jgi:phage tail-like protein
VDGFPPPILYALLRDRATWHGDSVGLVADASGALRLEPAPGRTNGDSIEPPEPYDVAASGIAVAPCGEVILVEGAEQRLVIETVCGDRATLGRPGIAPGTFQRPTGIAVASGNRLFVADTGNARVQGFRLPELGLVALWDGVGFAQPEAMAADSEGRLVLADRGTRTVRRFLGEGPEDLGFATNASSGDSFQDPRFLAIGADDWVLVSDAGREEVLVLDAAGSWLGPLAAPSSGWRPRALVAVGPRLYVADATTGWIWLMDGPTGHWFGPLRGWRGPVAGLAAASDGDLLVKPGPDAAYHRLPHDAACLASGRLDAGPFDAGIGNGWHILRVQADVPAEARLTVSFAVAPAAVTRPALTSWADLPGASGLVEVVTRGAATSLAARRFLWLRVDLESLNGPATPLLRQVEAATAGERLIDYLPGIYAREDGAWNDPPEAGTPRAFLRRLLDLLGDGLMQAEGVVDLFAQRLDPHFAPGADLRWLADWVALDLPAQLGPDAWRALLVRAVALHARGGTPAHLREVAALHTGLAVRIEEEFAHRAVWVLGGGRGLGFDTALPRVDPEGLVLEGEGREDKGAGCRPLLGGAVLGATSPIAEADAFTPLFEPMAHRFAVQVPPTPDADPRIALLREVLDREKPAHTEYTLCVTRPLMQVGVQARLGVDTIIAAGPSAGRLEEARLGRDARLASTRQAGTEGRLGSGGASVVGQGLRVR